METTETETVAATVTSAGIDYLTATAFRTPKHHDFREVTETILERVIREGNEVSTWRANGYHGRRAGGVAVGVRHDTWIARLSSDDARESWREVYQRASNVSRLDVQVTFRLDEPDIDFFHRQRLRALASRTKRGRRSNVTLITSSLDGDSLYLGKRTSDLYARCYDKGREEKSASAGVLVRQELEYKRDRAKDAAEQIYRAASEVTETHQLVSSFFKTHAIQTIQNDAKREVGARGRTTSIDAKLAWLRTAVAPSISFLITHDRLSDTLTALGLDKLVQPKLTGSDENFDEEE